MDGIQWNPHRGGGRKEVSIPARLWKRIALSARTHNIGGERRVINLPPVLWRQGETNGFAALNTIREFDPIRGSKHPAPGIGTGNNQYKVRATGNQDLQPTIRRVAKSTGQSYKSDKKRNQTWSHECFHISRVLMGVDRLSIIIAHSQFEKGAVIPLHQSSGILSNSIIPNRHWHSNEGKWTKTQENSGPKHVFLN